MNIPQEINQIFPLGFVSPYLPLPQPLINNHPCEEVPGIRQLLGHFISRTAVTVSLLLSSTFRLLGLPESLGEFIFEN